MLNTVQCMDLTLTLGFFRDASSQGLKNATVTNWSGLSQKNTRANLVAQSVKNLPAAQETRVRSLAREDSLEKEMATHSSILARKIPRTEEPGGLQSTGSQRVGHN